MDRVNSDSVNITRAYLQATDRVVWELRGTVSNRFSSRGYIPGHLHVELIGSNGAVFKKADVGYKRQGIKSRLTKFHLSIPDDLSDVHHIRVIHHNAGSVKPSPISPWQDMTPIK